MIAQDEIKRERPNMKQSFKRNADVVGRQWTPDSASKPSQIIRPPNQSAHNK